MRKNKFSEYQIEILETAFDLGEKITIRGVNGIGQPFEVTSKTGYSDFVYKRNACVYEDRIELRFDRYNTYGINGRYYLNFLDEEKLPEDYLTDSTIPVAGLIVKEILDSQGNTIYKNEDFKLVEIQCAKNKERYMHDFLQPKEIIDPVTKRLQTMIGKPVIINNQRYRDLESDVTGILHGIIGIGSNGCIKVLVDENGRMFNCVPIHPSTCLMKLDKNGHWCMDVDNRSDTAEFEKICDTFKKYDFQYEDYSRKIKDRKENQENE